MTFFTINLVNIFHSFPSIVLSTLKMLNFLRGYIERPENKNVIELFKFLKFFLANVLLEFANVTAEVEEKMLTSQTFQLKEAIVHHRQSYRESKMYITIKIYFLGIGCLISLKIISNVNEMHYRQNKSLILYKHLEVPIIKSQLLVRQVLERKTRQQLF